MTTSKPRVRAYVDYVDENSFFTEAELEALSRVATEEAIRKEQQTASEEDI